MVVTVDDPALTAFVDLVHDFDGKVNLGCGPLDDVRPREEEPLDLGAMARAVAGLGVQLCNLARKPAPASRFRFREGNRLGTVEVGGEDAVADRVGERVAGLQDSAEEVEDCACAVVVAGAFRSRGKAEPRAEERLIEQRSVCRRAQTMDLVGHQEQMRTLSEAGAERVGAYSLHRAEHDPSPIGFGPITKYVAPSVEASTNPQDLGAKRFECGPDFFKPLCEQRLVGYHDDRHLVELRERLADGVEGGEGLPSTGRKGKNSSSRVRAPRCETSGLMRHECPSPDICLHVTGGGNGFGALPQQAFNRPLPVGVRRRHERFASGVGEGADVESGVGVCPQLFEVRSLLNRAFLVPSAEPGARDVDRLEVSVFRKSGPSLVHRTLEDDDRTLSVAQNAEFVVEDARRRGARHRVEDGDFELDDFDRHERRQNPRGFRHRFVLKERGNLVTKPGPDRLVQPCLIPFVERLYVRGREHLRAEDADAPAV